LTKIPLGHSAYNRKTAKEPEIQLLNRFFEKNPTNTDDGVALLSRGGTQELAFFTPDTATGSIRLTYSKEGLFGGDAFVVSGTKLYRYAADGTITPISGVLNDNGRVFVTWTRGAGYERVFFSDGLLLQYYDGGSQATGTLTTTVTPTNQVIEIGGIYYTWAADVTLAPGNGTAASPFCAKLTADPLLSLANTLAFIGTPGVDFSATIGSQNLEVTAKAGPQGPPATTLDLTSRGTTTASNAITTTVYSGTGLSFGAATLTGGGIESLKGVYCPTGEALGALATLDSFVFVAVPGSQKFFYIQPGAVVIEALDFASKESNPDPIVDLLRVGDKLLICGEGSIETWYGTGNSLNPFAPINGRTTARGIVAGTLSLLQDTAILVGDDGVVYAVANTLQRISTHGIEERIRTQIFQREKGLIP
jgi:hypothetical protein